MMNKSRSFITTVYELKEWSDSLAHTQNDPHIIIINLTIITTHGQASFPFQATHKKFPS